MKSILAYFLKNAFKKPRILLASCVISLIVCLLLYAVTFRGYIAKAKIVVTNAAVGDTESDSDKRSDRALRTIAEFVKSRFLMEEVVKELNLERAFDKEDPVDKLMSIIDARPIRGSEVLEISVRLDRPELAAMIASAICKVIITDSRKDRFSFEKDMLSWLADQGAGMRKELDDAAARLRKFKESVGMADIAAEHDGMWMRIEKLRNNLAAVKSAMLNSEAGYNDIKTHMDSGAAPGDIPYVQNDSEYKKLQLEHEKYRKERQELLNMYQPGHPSIVELDQKLSRLGAAIPERAEAIVNEVKQGYEAPKAKEAELEKMIAKENGELLRLEEKLDEYNSLADGLKEKEVAYNAFLKKIEEGFEMDGLRIRQVELLEPAYLPKRREGPSLALFIFLGLILGVFACGAYNLISQRKPLPQKEEAPEASAKKKGMYIERVNDKGWNQ